MARGVYELEKLSVIEEEQSMGVALQCKVRYEYYKEGCIIRHQSLGAAEMTIETILQPLPKAALHKRLQPTNLHMI